MDIFFPAQTLPLFQAFAPCFTAPSFAYFQSYGWALMVVEGRQCLTRLARCTCFHQRALSSWERFLAEHRGSLTTVTERLVTLGVAKLGAPLQVHGASLLGTAPPWSPRPPRGGWGARRGKTLATTRTAVPIWSATTGIWWGCSARGARGGGVGL